MYLMFGNFLVSFIGAFLLTVWGDQSLILLWIGSGLLGAGFGSMFATGILWFKSHMKVTNAIGAAICVSSSVGAAVFPRIAGQLMEDYPMTLMYLTTASIILASLMFISSIF